MKNLSVKMKLAVGSGSLLVIPVALSAFSVFTLNRANDAFEAARFATEKRGLALELESSVEKQTTAVRGFLLTGRQDLLKHDEEGKQSQGEALDQLRQSVHTEQGKQYLAEIMRLLPIWRGYADREIELRRQNKDKEAVDMAFGEQVSQARNDLRKTITTMVDYQQMREEEALRLERAQQAQARWLIIGVSLFGVVVGSLLSWLVARSITGITARMLALIHQVAANNLAAEDIFVNSNDELGKAALALNHMKNNLREIIQTIAGTAEHVASASEEISSSAQQSVQGAETQKDQAVQVATAMQEMSATVMQVSDNSQRAAEAARSAELKAREGGTIVEETLNKMRTIAASVSATASKMTELGKSSVQIGNIIGVIDDIADQTNLLALNAAIEAARAGEQGRGFAVVADEVRKLAERTTTATKEIAQMIQNIQDETKIAVQAMEDGNKQVEDGVRSTAQAGSSLKEIIGMSEQVGEMITHIATAATEQASATEQVNSNMDQIALLVKESAVGSQQSAKACQDLSSLALDLQGMVGKFRFEESRPASREDGSSLRAGTMRKGKTMAAGAGR